MTEIDHIRITPDIPAGDQPLQVDFTGPAQEIANGHIVALATEGLPGDASPIAYATENLRLAGNLLIIGALLHGREYDSDTGRDILLGAFPAGSLPYRTVQRDRVAPGLHIASLLPDTGEARYAANVGAALWAATHAAEAIRRSPNIYKLQTSTDGQVNTFRRDLHPRRKLLRRDHVHSFEVAVGASAGVALLGIGAISETGATEAQLNVGIDPSSGTTMLRVGGKMYSNPGTIATPRLAVLANRVNYALQEATK